jgi:four helix bundle protein
VDAGYRNLVVWQRSMELALGVYRCTKTFPRDETYGLVSHMRRAAVSVPSNIAAGKGRYPPKELVQFLCHARGSLLELQTQITIAQGLGYMHPTDADELEKQISTGGSALERIGPPL